MTDARNLVTVQRLIPAPAAAIFDLLADPSRHPQIDGSGTVIAPTSAGSRRLGLGDTFGMSMKLGVPYSTRNVVVEFEPDRLIAWQTLAAAPLDKVVTGRVWRYELEPVELGLEGLGDRGHGWGSPLAVRGCAAPDSSEAAQVNGPAMAPVPLSG